MSWTCTHDWKLRFQTERRMMMGFLMDEDGIDSLIYEYFHDGEYY